MTGLERLISWTAPEMNVRTSTTTFQSPNFVWTISFIWHHPKSIVWAIPFNTQPILSFVQTISISFSGQHVRRLNGGVSNHLHVVLAQRGWASRFVHRVDDG